MHKPPSISVFSYTNYREFLKDWYQATKSSRASMSFRTFSERGGFKSTNILKFVMEGKRNLTEDSIVKFATALKLNKQESDFFRNLVYMNQAESHDARDNHYKKMLQSKKYGNLKPIEKNQYEFYSAWYHPVVRELVCQDEYKGNIAWLLSRIHPSITETQALKSIEVLENLGFIRKKDGKYEQHETLITTGPESASIALHNYHQNMLTLAKELLPLVPAAKRDVSALTLGVASHKIPELKKKIREFREDILKFVSQDNKADEIVALTLQLFPLTK
ncbi:TIGR02147 family protein [bacterium]|nr:TIGR02147 family protein [bacterium]